MGDSWSAEERLRLFDRLASCTSFSVIADRFLEPLASALQATSSVFLEFAERPGQGIGIGKRNYLGARPWSVDVYAERFFRDDPLVESDLTRFQTVDEDVVPSVSALPLAGDWRDSDYYRRFLRPFDIAHVMGIRVPYRSALGRQLLCVGFHRRHVDAPFGAAEVGLLRQLAPLIGSVLSGIAARDASSVSGVLLDRVARVRSGSGYLVFDEEFTLLHAGGSAVDDLCIHEAGARRSSEPDHSLLGQLRQRLRAMAPRPGGAPVRFSMVRPGEAMPIDIEAEAVATAIGQRYVATTTATAGRRDTTDVWRRLKLTERETEVARLVCAGHSNTAIGRTLGISLRTVENHLRSIYAKAHVSSRTQLAARAVS